MIFHNSGVVWNESFLKNWQKSKSFEMLQNRFWRLFKRPFYVSFDIFISTSRTTLIFLPTHSLMFGECFRYLQSVLKMIFHNSGVVWNENLLKKMEKTQIFRDAPKSVLTTFLNALFTFFKGILISNGSRIVRNHFWHTLKVSEIFSEHQGMRR